jgi:hypothetical protein
MPKRHEASQESQPTSRYRAVPRGWSSGRARRLVVGCGVALIMLSRPELAQAGKLSWLDDVVHDVIVEAKSGAKGFVRNGDTTRAEIRGAGRLFLIHDGDESLERLVRRADELARGTRKVEPPVQALLEARFSRLLKQDPRAMRTFSSLKPAEKRLVVELGETAQQLARRYPDEAETMVRRLGPDGLIAIRIFGDDVTEVLVREGPESLGVLRKAGRGGWAFFTREVLPHKKKLAAAGVLAAFLANPEKFVDSAGQATEFAVREFAKAGIQLVTALGGGAARGIQSSMDQTLAAYGLHSPALRYFGIGLSSLIVVLSLLVIVGLPVRWIFRPFGWALRRLAGRRRVA